MANEKFFRAAAGRPAIQDLLKQIRGADSGTPGLDRLLSLAQGFALVDNIRLSKAEIFALVKNAEGDDLAIVEGESPFVVLSCSGDG